MFSLPGLPPSRTEDVYNAALHVMDQTLALQSRWFDMSKIIIDVVACTISLGVMSLLVAWMVYVVATKSPGKGSMISCTLLFVLPDWTTSIVTWIMSLSVAAQVYALQGSHIATIRSRLQGILHCVGDVSCADIHSNLDFENKPIYVDHGCVGTGLLAADLVLRAVACVAILIIWPWPDHDKSRRWTAGGCLLVPLVATCVSATMHVKQVCFPRDASFADDHRIMSVWEVTDPVPVDATTSKLFALTHMASLLLVIHQTWVNREAYNIRWGDFNTSTFIHAILPTFAIPFCITRAWSAMHQSCDGGWTIDSALIYALFSFTDRVLMPLVALYPIVSFMVQKLRESENRGPPALESDKAGSAEEPSTMAASQGRIEDKMGLASDTSDARS